MKKIEPKTKYRTCDGREFVDEEAAQRHEQIVKAKQTWECARAELGRALAEAAVTADGFPFEFSLWQTYYWITPGYFGLPNLIGVDFWGRNWEWSCEPDEGKEDGQVILYDCKDDRGNPTQERRRFPIKELYRDKGTAHEALRAAQRKWLDEVNRRLEARETLP